MKRFYSNAFEWPPTVKLPALPPDTYLLHLFQLAASPLVAQLAALVKKLPCLVQILSDTAAKAVTIAEITATRPITGRAGLQVERRRLRRILAYAASAGKNIAQIAASHPIAVIAGRGIQLRGVGVVFDHAAAAGIENA
jgi:hypothetical protein